MATEHAGEISPSILVNHTLITKLPLEIVRLSLLSTLSSLFKNFKVIHSDLFIDKFINLYFWNVLQRKREI